ncbi:VIT1/CCC1 transporter family protein [Tsukamurella pseudospumae]|nr:VIT1/CCC1 transporter family protein [Tsukamurella pseudospumae]
MIDGPLAPRRSAWSRARYRMRRTSSPRSWAVDANDGIIGTAGLLEGFAGAGAGDSVLMTAACAATIAGSLAVGGAKWAEDAAERDAETHIIDEERAQLAAAPDDELAELAAYWETKGLDPATAAAAAAQLSARDALAAQLEYEHGIVRPIPAWHPAWAGLSSSLAYVSGAIVPLVLTVSVPVGVEVWAIAIAVIASLVLTSVIAGRRSHISVRRLIVRTVLVGAATMLISYLVGALLL